jgi:hypothetical protein
MMAACLIASLPIAIIDISDRGEVFLGISTAARHVVPDDINRKSAFICSKPIRRGW